MNNNDPRTPADEFVRSIDIHTLLPQQEPFVMVSRIEHFDMACIRTTLAVTDDNIFVNEGQMTASGVMENIAQTCAARIGYINVYVLKKGVQIGVIGAIRNFSEQRSPRVGETLHTEICVREEAFGMILADASVCVDGEVLATCEMKIAVREDEA